MSRVLVDSSAWIDFLRGRPEAVKRVDTLLVEDLAATAGVITAEVASGARTRVEFEELRVMLAALPQLEAPPDLWDRVAEARFSLARQGAQANLVDLAIAVTASAAGSRLLTRDRDFVAIARATTVDLDLF